MSRKLITVLLFSFTLIFAGMGIGVIIPSLISESHLSVEESFVELVIIILMGISGFFASIISNMQYE